MRIGQRVSYNSLAEGSGKVFNGVVKMFEYDPDGYAVVMLDGQESWPEWAIVHRARLKVAQPPAKFSAKGGGDDPAGSPALMAEVA